MGKQRSFYILLIVIVVIVVVFSAYLLIFKKTDKIPFIEGKELTFNTIAKGFNSQHEERKNYVINNSKDWGILWDKVPAEIPKPTLPNIDFNQKIVVAIFLGSISTGGYSVDIVKVVEKDSTIEVIVKKTSPGSDCMVTQAFTQPYHIIETQRSNKEIKFVTYEEVIACSSGLERIILNLFS